MNTEQPEWCGYHFSVGFVPTWDVIMPSLVARARRLGYGVTDDGSELVPLASSLTFTGTRWMSCGRGDLRFDVLAHRRDLRANVIKVAGCVRVDEPHSFEIAHPERLGDVSDVFRHEAAVGVWLSGGSLVLMATDQPATEPQEMLARFEVWSALEELWRLSIGEPTALVVIGEAELSCSYAPPGWAPDFTTMRVRSFQEELRAVLRHPNMTVTMSLLPIHGRLDKRPLGRDDHA